MNNRKIAKLALGIVLAGIFLWLIFRHINLAELKKAFDEANTYFIATALAAFILGYSCRIERWRVMLRHDNQDLRWTSCAGPFLASVAANNVLPFRAGDLFRAFGFNRKLGISAAASLTSLFIERLLDLLAILILLGLTLTYFGMEFSHFLGVGGMSLIAVAIVILIVLLFPHLFKPLAISFGAFTSKAFPKIGLKLAEEINKIFSALEHLARGTTMLKLALWTLLAWGAEGLVFWFSALALPAILHPAAAWLALPIGTLATVIPSTPGYVGTFDFFSVQAMTAFGNSKTASTAYTLLVHALLWLPPTIFGGAYLLLHRTKQQEKLGAA